MIKSSMKKERIEIVLDKGIFLTIKERSAKEGKKLDEIIEAAILNYIGVSSGSMNLRRFAASSFCSKPFNINTSDLHSLFYQ
jgi:hypothetical protein